MQPGTPRLLDWGLFGNVGLWLPEHVGSGERQMKNWAPGDVVIRNKTGKLVAIPVIGRA